MRKENWKEEFEDKINIIKSNEGESFIYIFNNNYKFLDILNKYLKIVSQGSSIKVKIKARENCIQIEKIEG